MFRLSIKEILEATGGRLISRGERDFITGVSTDTRTVKEGDLFIALKGPNFNGHNFVDEAIKKGASAVIVKLSNCQIVKASKLNVIQVRDTLKALGDIAHYYRLRFDIPSIGITGSSGKTTVKEMIYSVLRPAFCVLKNEGTENNLVGVPQTLLRLNPEHKMAVLELGTNHFGEIGRLAQLLNPTVGIIMNIGPSHLEFLKSEKGVFKEKSQLLNYLDKNSVVILNADDRFLSKIKRLRSPRFGGAGIIRFGIDQPCDFRAAGILEEGGSIRFTVNNKHDFKINLLGRHNVYNALAAITVGFFYGLSAEDVSKALLGFAPVKGRLCVIRFGPIAVIDDTYNSNPQSLNAALSALKGYNSAGRKILVLGDMLELGKRSVRFHYESGRLAVKAGIDYLVTVGNFSESVKEGAVVSGLTKDAVFSCKNNVSVMDILKKILKEGDVLLLKGSRRMKLDEVVNALPSFISFKRALVRV